MSDETFMRRAIAVARDGMQRKVGGPFGAVVVRDGVIIGEGSNSVTSLNDPTAHAEVTAVRRACERIGNFSLAGAVIYTTCEPCPMCYGAIFWARLGEVVYASTRADAADAGFDDSALWHEFGGLRANHRLPLRRLLLPDAGALFGEWKRMAEKIPY